ncbi:hypothetical protein ACEPAI_8725 [Sanghuangporus weigelae]
MEALPPEILCDIFLQSLPDKLDKLDVPYETSISAPLYISHGCRAWRSLALAYGDLWSYLCIDYAIMSRNKRKMVVNIFETWLSKTNGLPISYVFRCGLTEGFGVEDHRRAECIITTLLSQQYQWRDVDFTWYGVDVSDKFPGLDMTHMPILASLSLSVNLPMRATISIARSSRLKKLDLFGNFDLSIIREPLCLLIGGRIECSSKYGYIASHAIETSRYLDLNSAPFLTKFDVRFASSLVSSNRSNHHPRLILPSLRALKLEYGEAPATILDSITSPFLEALYYTCSVKKGILFSLFQRSKPPLTFLALHDSCAGEDDILGILRMLPYLKDLRYSNAFVSKRFFRELAVEMRENEEIVLSAERTICPRLEILHLHSLLPLDGISECVETLISMMKSRARIQKSFGSIILDLDIANSLEINMSDIDRYTDALGQCFEDREGQLVVGDYDYVLSKFFPPNSN